MHLSYFSVPWIGMSGGPAMVVPRFYPSRVWFFQWYCLWVVCYFLNHYQPFIQDFWKMKNIFFSETVSWVAVSDASSNYSCKNGMLWFGKPDTIFFEFLVKNYPGYPFFRKFGQNRDPQKNYGVKSSSRHHLPTFENMVVPDVVMFLSNVSPKRLKLPSWGWSH